MTQRALARTLGLLTLGLCLLPTSTALAHWCNCLWASGYNLVVRPAQDSVSVAAGTPATLDVYVQNNMGYPLLSFVLTAKATGYTINVSGPSPKVLNYLMPGEKLKKTLTITRSTAATLNVESIDFYVSFGNAGQSNVYGIYSSPHNAVAIRKTDGTLAPAALGGLGSGGSGDQGMYLRNMALADYGDLAAALDRTHLVSPNLPGLMEEYCSGRGSWDHSNVNSLVNTYCKDLSTTTCPARYTETALTKYDAQHLWSATALVERKSVLGASRIAALRARFQCGWADDSPAARYIAAFGLGYLGDDPTARTFLTGIVNGTGSAADKNVAKAALLLMGQTQYSADVNACAVPTGDSYAASVCAAAVGIIERKDQPVIDVLLARSRWECPGDCDGGDPADPTGFFASHLLSVVSWDRRGYAASSADTGEASYYGPGVVDTVAPKVPTGISCTATNNSGTLQARWSAVTQGVDNNPEPGTVSYRVYWDTAPHAGCAKPSDPGCNYGHVDPSTALYRDYASSTGTSTFYYRITAVDAAGNESAYSDEVNCVPRYTPVANLSCTPSSGPAPLDVTCDASGSTDSNGASDITTYSFKLDSAPASAGATKTAAYSGLAQGGHVVILTVTDSTSLTNTTTRSITVGAPPGPDAGPAGLDAAAPPGPDASSTPGPDASSEPLDAGVPVPPDAASPGPDAAAPGLDAAAPGTDAATLEMPIAQASGTPGTGAAPLLVSFDSAGSSDPQGLPLTFTWDFGDTSPTASGPTATHTYNTAGTYVATLTVANSAGLSNVAAVITEVREGANHPPDLSTVSATPLTGTVPLEVSFNAGGVTDPDGHAFTLRWDFGDNASSTEASPKHTYAAVGVYTARISAQDDGTPAIGPATRDFRIEVTEASTPNRAPDCSAASVSPLSGNVPFLITLNASGCTDPDGDPLTYEWRVPTSLTTPDVVFTTAEVSYTFPETTAERDAAPLTLTLRDNGTPPLECSRQFEIDIKSPSVGPPPVDPDATSTITSACGCSASAGSSGGFTATLFALAFLMRRRRAS
ncbi:MAG: PKD domain-containing protein [Myxococcales bacterium]